MADEELPDDENLVVDETDDETVADPVDEPDTEGTESEDADGADEVEPLAADAPPSRGNRAIGALRQQARETAQQLAETTRQLDELRRGVNQPRSPVESVQERANRLALLSPEDRIREEMREAFERNERNTQALATQLMDESDRNAFQARTQSDSLARKLAPEVERRLVAYRSSGNNIKRGVLFTYLVGEKALEQRGKPNKQAAANRQRQQTRPARSGSDVRPDRRGERAGNGADDFERRYGDSPI